MESSSSSSIRKSRRDPQQVPGVSLHFSAALLTLALLLACNATTSAAAQQPNRDARIVAGAGENSSSGVSATFTRVPPYDPSLEIAVLTPDDQQDSQSNLPPAPDPKNGTIVKRNPQTRRILGIIPNFRSVSTDEKLPPQTPKQKFITTSQDAFDYSSAVIPVLLAGYNMATNATPEFGQGAEGYGKYLWHSALDQTTEDYFVEFVFPVLTHEDSRYYTMGRGGFLKRTVYSVSRAVITRSDSGRNTLNISEIAGAGASAGLAAAYYPAQERDFPTAAKNWGLDVGIDAFTFVLKEFWPDINHSVFHYNDAQ